MSDVVTKEGILHFDAGSGEIKLNDSVYGEVTWNGEPILTEAEKILKDAELRLKRLDTNLTRLQLKVERTSAAKAELEKFVRSAKRMLQAMKPVCAECQKHGADCHCGE